MENEINVSRVYSEVYSFLNTLGKQYIDKIPSDVYNVIQSRRDKMFNPAYSTHQDVENDTFSKEALALIATINLNYWCEDGEERQKLKAAYEKNSKMIKEVLQIEFDPNKVFKNKQSSLAENVNTTSSQLVDYKPSLIKKILNKIKSILFGKG